MKKYILIILCSMQGMLWADEIREVPIINMQDVYQKLSLAGKLDFCIFQQAYLGFLTISNKNADYLAIIDYTKPSNEKRFFLLDMINYKIVNQTYVSHAKNTGLDTAVHFSNDRNSMQSSLGF